MKTALITGVSGQDGRYLARLLLRQGYRVVGTSRDAVRATGELKAEVAAGLEILDLDLLDQQAIHATLAELAADEIYNLAACARGFSMWDEPVAIAETNGVVVARLLEGIRIADPGIRFCQASSSEMFGLTATSPQTESTTFLPRSPYGAAKLFAHNMVNIYRSHHGLFCCSAILFNHESPHRSTDFVSRKITHEAVRIKLGLATRLPLGNLEARRDWGYAGDYVQALWLMLQHKDAMDYVVATGETHSVREACDIAFSHLDLDYRDHVVQQDSHYREAEAIQLVGDSSRLRNTLGWRPRLGFREMIQSMVDTDMELLRTMDKR